MLVQINGSKTEIPDGLSIEQLMRARNLPYTIIVELNGNIIKAERWGDTRLNPDDSLEMIQLVVGG
ncbi:MAG: sulfur carrier protein ThiS [Chloroflexi bacterium]|nr:sulfur carrier protein ThiS [Chloroflexota bacterium]